MIRHKDGRKTNTKIFLGWFVAAACALVGAGILGGQFSFGVFLKPMTEEFGWSRASLSLVLAIPLVVQGLLRPAGGYVADRYNPKIVVLSGVMLMGIMLLLLPLIDSLTQFYIVFTVIGVGVALGAGPILTKIASAWFQRRRGLVLSMVSGGGFVGAAILVPGTSLFLVLFDWREAYVFLGGFLLLLVLPVGFVLLKNRPQDVGLQPYGALNSASAQNAGPSNSSDPLLKRDSTLNEAVRSSLFWRLTFGSFV